MVERVTVGELGGRRPPKQYLAVILETRWLHY